MASTLKRAHSPKHSGRFSVLHYVSTLLQGGVEHGGGPHRRPGALTPHGMRGILLLSGYASRNRGFVIPRTDVTVLGMYIFT